MSSYQSVHYQLRKIRCKASEYRCAHCPNQATQWAYDHQDPDERLGRYDVTARLTAYSLKLEHYLPLCKPCHTRLDSPPSRASQGLPSAWDPGTWNQAAWNKVRGEVLARDRYTCQLRVPGICTHEATVAHHTRDRLVYGDDPAYLLAACRPCNSSVHDPTHPHPAPARQRGPRTPEQRERRRLIRKDQGQPTRVTTTSQTIHVDAYLL